MILALGAAGLSGALAWLLALAGLWGCQPKALPGDEAWMLFYLARQAAGVMAAAPPTSCVETAPSLALTLSPWVLKAGLALPVLVLLWEVLGWPARLWLLRMRGGHAVLAGPMADLAPLAGGLSRLWLLPEAQEAAAHRAGAFAHRLPMAAMLQEASVKRLGLGRAALVVAATSDDLANFRLARAALAAGFNRRLLVRLDGRGLRSLAGDDLRASPGSAGLVIAAPAVVQAREALSLSLPGRFTYDDAGGGAVHLALCGDGAGIEAMVLLLARQGYGLERAIPQLSLLTLGAEGGPPVVIPSGLDDVISLGLRDLTTDDPDRIDSEIAAMAVRGPRLSAVFCLSDTPGRAGLLAARWHRVMGDLGLTVPPLVALEPGPFAAAPAGVRVAVRPGLAEIEARQTRLDSRAMAVHAHYLELMERADTGPAPARRPWAGLAERYRDDSRAAADHIDYKLALCGLIAQPGEGAGAFHAAELDQLAQVEHARWMAARRVAGWSKGPRDDRALLHPDLVPFQDLDPLAQEKDRDQVARLPEVLAKGGEGVLREWRLQPGANALPLAEAGPSLVAALRDLALRHPGHLPLLQVSATPRNLSLGLGVATAGGRVEMILSDSDGPAATTADAIRLRGLAWRVRVVADPVARMQAAPPALTKAGKVCDSVPP